MSNHHTHYTRSPDARQIACKACDGERCDHCKQRGYFTERLYRRLDPEAQRLRILLLSDRTTLAPVRMKDSKPDPEIAAAWKAVLS